MTAPAGSWLLPLTLNSKVSAFENSSCEWPMRKIWSFLSHKRAVAATHAHSPGVQQARAVGI